MSIDGTSQPEFAGTPLIALGGDSTVVTIATGNLIVRGLSFSQVAIDASTSEQLLASEDNNGLTTGLTLLDSQRNVLVHGNVLSPTNRDSVLDEYLATGTYSVVSSGAVGAGNAALSLSLTPASSPTQPIPVTSLASNLGGYPVDEPIPMAVGDFTGDGMLDIATPAGLYLGLGDGTFQYPPISLGLPDLVSSTFLINGYTDIIAGDFTGNGKLDLALTNQVSDSVVILLGNGDGTFQPPMSFAAGVFPQSLVAGDLTGNGKLDLAVADLGITNGAEPVNPGGGVSILLGNGDGTFQPPTLYAAGNYPVAVIAGDFNADGKLDLAVADDGDQNGYATAAGGVSVLLGNGNGTFQPPVTYGAGSGPASLITGDFTGDGKLDLAVADPGVLDGRDPGGVYVLLGNGDGTFQTATVYASGEGGIGPGSLVAGDFTGDGKLDLAVAANSLDQLLFLKGNGDGTFLPPVGTTLNLPDEGGSVFLSIVAADFNGDGRLDLAIADATGYSDFLKPSSAANSFEVLLGNGDGTFEQGGGTAIGGGFAKAISADFTGDGNLDLATYNYATNEVSILLGNGGGGFQLSSQFASGLPMVADDFNGDGRIDLAAAASNGVAILLGNGDGTFQTATTYSLGFSPTAIVAGDFSNDGILDLAAVGTPASGVGGGELAILMGNGDGTFRATVSYPIGANPGSILAGDFAGSGKLDLAFLDSAADDSPADSDTVSVMLGNGDGTFQTPVNYLAGPASGSLATSTSLVADDFTGDGKLDLLVSTELITGGTLASLFFGNTISILMGNGDGTFQASRTFLKLPEPFFPECYTTFRSSLAISMMTAWAIWPSMTPAPTRLTWCSATVQAPFSRYLTTQRTALSACWPGISRELAGWTSPSSPPTRPQFCSTTGMARFETPASSPSRPVPTRWSSTSMATAPTTPWSSTGRARSSIVKASPASREPSSPRSSSTRRWQTARIHMPRATLPGCRTPTKVPSSLVSIPRPTRSSSLLTATAVLSCSAVRSPPASSRHRSSRPTWMATV